MQAFLDTYHSLILQLGTNTMLALSMYIALRAGVFSVATVGGASLGAYGSALATIHWHVPLAVALVVGVIVAMLAALILALPVLRLSYMYLAIATLVFNEIVRFALHNWSFAGGAGGLFGIPNTAGLWTVWSVLAILVAAFVVFERTAFGRLWRATGADPVVVSGLGYSAGRLRLYALVASLGIAAVAGGLRVHYSYIVAPDDFGFGLVTDVLSFVILGGMASVWGPVVGTAVLTILPEALRFVGTYRGSINAAIVVLVVILYPQGLLGVLGYFGRGARFVTSRLRGPSGTIQVTDASLGDPPADAQPKQGTSGAGGVP
jgi:branched-chain amino acid transport system permease protein